MNVYRWIHLDSEGYKKDGPFTIIAEDINRAKELITRYIRGMTFSEGDTTSLECFGYSHQSIESIIDNNPDFD